MRPDRMPTDRGNARPPDGRARTLLERLEGPTPAQHPVTELLGVAATCRAWMTYCVERVAELERLDNRDDANRVQEQAIVVIFERSLDRAAKVFADLARLDLDERWFRLAAAEALMVDEAVSAVLSDMGLAGRIGEFRERFGEHLSRGLADEPPARAGKRPLPAVGHDRRHVGAAPQKGSGHAT